MKRPRPSLGPHAESGRSAGVLIALFRKQIERRARPLVVGIDGRSGVGKSTLLAAVADELAKTSGGTDQVTLIDGDDFYTGGSADMWDGRSAADDASRAIDWRRQRNVLKQLLGDGVAQWQAFDWNSDRWDGEVAPLVAVPTVAHAAPVIAIDGTYSCQPTLHDLLDLRIVLEAPRMVRQRRVRERDGDAYDVAWDARWSAAEDHYFGRVMPPERFDVVLGRP